MAFLSLPLAPGGHYCGFSFSSSMFCDKDAHTVFIKRFKDADLLDHYQMMFLSENESRGLRQTSTCSYTSKVHREENKICRNESSSNIQNKKQKEGHKPKYGGQALYFLMLSV